MTSGAADLRRSVPRGWSEFPWCSRWFSSVPGIEVDDAREGSWCHSFVMCPFLATKSSYVEVDVDEIAYPLHHAIFCNCQKRAHDFVSGATLSHRAVVASGIFWGIGSPPGLDICWRVDRFSTCTTESYIG
jgi:hypothetical protein